jgi:hypothetical protein
MGFYQFFVQNALVLGKLVRIMFTIFIFIKVNLQQSITNSDVSLKLPERALAPIVPLMERTVETG